MEKQAQRKGLTSFPQIYIAGSLICVPPKPIPGQGFDCRWFIWKRWEHELGKEGSEMGVLMTLPVPGPGLRPAEGPLKPCRQTTKDREA